MEKDNLEKFNLRQKKENIWNLANLLTFSRIIITFITIFLIFAEFNVIIIALAFFIGMFTDFLDGQAARRFNLKTEFGRQFDMIADRILIVGVAFAILIKFSIAGLLSNSHLFQIFFMLSREILTTPVALITMSFGAGIPQVRFIGKITTFLQTFAFPTILLSIFYDFFNFAIYLSIITGIAGLISAFYYINDMKVLMIKRMNQINQKK